MNPIRFDGKVAIVTGGGNGLGREYCLELAKRGANVVVNDLGCSGSGEGRSQAVADAVVAEIKAAGGSAVANYDSVGTRAGGANIVKTAVDAFGAVDIVINNAGILRNGRFEDLTDEQIDLLLDVHLKGAFYVTQPAMKIMKARKYGRILFTASASALYGHPWQANYAAAKGGLMALAHVVALEGREHNIFSNALMPTADTRLSAEMSPDWMEVTHVAEILKQVDFAAHAESFKAVCNMPLALYLVSEHCKTTHGIFSHAMGRYARVFVGATQGWKTSAGQLPSIEDIAEHWTQIEDTKRYDRPESVYEEFFLVKQGGKKS